MKRSSYSRCLASSRQPITSTSRVLGLA